MSLKPYPSYKHSGISWIGKVPSHWMITRSDRFICSDNKIVSASELNNKEIFHYSIPVVQKTGDGQKENGDEVDSSKLLIEQTQILISKLNPRKNTVCIANPQDILTVCSGEFVPLTAQQIDIKLLYYVVSSQDFRKRLESLVESATRSHQRVNPSDIIKFKGAFPPVNEQQKIAQFLDYETAKIDALIDEQKRLIELLKEKRQAVISHAVTKGLNPDVPMKDSGVEWLGEVPDHWKLGRLKNHLRLKNGQDYKTVETESADGFPVIGSGGQFTKATKFLHNGESVLLGRKGTIDKPLYINGKFWTVDTMFYSEVFNSSSAKYVYYLAMTVPFSLYSTNTALPSMSQSDLHNHITVIPPLVEQSEIANYIDEQLEKMDRLSDRLLTNSKLLQERRSALISATVTGKIDVRDWQPPAGSDTVDSNASVQTERHYG